MRKPRYEQGEQGSLAGRLLVELSFMVELGAIIGRRKRPGVYGMLFD